MSRLVAVTPVPVLSPASRTRFHHGVVTNNLPSAFVGDNTNNGEQLESRRDEDCESSLVINVAIGGSYASAGVVTGKPDSISSRCCHQQFA